MRREEAGDWEGAEALLQQAASLGNTEALAHLMVMRERGGDREGAEALALQAADLGSTDALLNLAAMRWRGGDRESADPLLQQAAGLGDTSALLDLAVKREGAGDREGAEALALQAADLGNPETPHSLRVGPELFSRLWPNGLDPEGTSTPHGNRRRPARSADTNRPTRRRGMTSFAAGDDPAGLSTHAVREMPGQAG